MKSGQLSQLLEGARVVAVIRKLSPDILEPVVEALVEGGIQALEITMDSSSAAQSMESIRTRYGARVAVGAGTVLSPAQLDSAVEAGAEFLVCPHLDVALVERANQVGVSIIPGVLTPTEVQMARSAGAEVVKIFPAGSVGASYIKDLLGPFSGLKIMATGGITEQNAVEFLQAGVVATGLGSALFPKEDVASRNWEAIRQRAQRVMQRVRGLSS
ncbi:bifunctional 4-hydroxy-2-oxoglutarate aldolase/2-dehydro-3-deoxy-phosphogluconate aldolase [Alicyclobacillus fastidiosus]|uniref:Bifunctional 4-hydroxy-2-oxoglutarate aldolase/2-dehydro-3-deoxy-phosphogluconate aldolase n=1 Tax=Alicyclobacillus fastidiosus TaxID=392011 RepID=A0ABY6ZDY8_9BACL|nr:bifunctional 4-hydroxy-2-oxoglutarate aldolase/2-dehydro-3-deoxy-phosphogluconate aldolase [Alicyclobacillus fastidiosus]WAH41100.1 bifunctional 4-hydroxy-2-oxoglutarate aldolase/2-dehydro-3-deoxy-phosphogluconate aldolase [Alicyclobacillus fastidiosus]GMA62655.1 2-dehydro-3-deoxy-phosphogluconate aldolase [Alicyclobacillus fastidiosus]